MSDRKLEDIDGLAALKLSHEMQIDALTKRGLTHEQRVLAFMHAAAGGVLTKKEIVLEALLITQNYMTAARIVWKLGDYPNCLFAYLPGCPWCPVQLKAVQLNGAYGDRRLQLNGAYGDRLPDIELPDEIPDFPDRTPPYDWDPDEKTLRAFAKVQQQARFPEIVQ